MGQFLNESLERTADSSNSAHVYARKNIFLDKLFEYSVVWETVELCLSEGLKSPL